MMCNLKTIKMEQKEILINAGLDWTVRKEPVMSESGIYIPKTICVIRDDTNHPLGVHKSGYELYQNHELLELLFNIGQRTGLSLHSGGMLGDGEKVWFQLKSSSHKMDDDRIDGFITGINSFDGRTSLAFGNSTKTISCQNTFWMAYREVETKLRHSSLMRPKLDDILKNVEKLLVEEEKMFQNIDRLSNVRITPELKELVTKMLFDIPLQERFEPAELSTNKQNKIIRFQNDFMTEVSQKGDHLWGLFSSVTRYSTHSMLKSGADNTPSKIVGSAGNKDRKIWKTLLSEVDA